MRDVDLAVPVRPWRQLQPAVARFGGALARAAWTGFLAAARDIAEQGSFAKMGDSVTAATLNQAFRDGQSRSAEDLGLDLGVSLQELHQRILHNDPRLDAAEPPARAAAVVPQQLPADIASFAGRETDVEALLRNRSGGSRVAVIDGMPGIGKTALAVHIAHWLAPQYPDGQIFCDLQGFSSDVAPGTLAHSIYGDVVTERHRHRYEANVNYLDDLRKAGLVISALTQREDLTEIVELPQNVHPWFMGVQFHPEFK